MAKAVSPVLAGLEHLEVKVAEDQPQYETLPMLPLLDEAGNILTRWEFTPEEVKFILEHGYVYVYTMTFGNKIQPMYVSGEEVHLGNREGLTPRTGDNGSRA